MADTQGDTQGEQATQELKAAPPPHVPTDGEKLAYVLARSRNSRGFNRGGFRWESNWQVVAFEAFESAAKEHNARLPPGSLRKRVTGRALIQSVLDESALDSQLVTAEEAERYRSTQARVISGDISPEQLHGLIVAQAKQIDDLQATVKNLQAALTGDRPPRTKAEQQDLVASSRGRSPAGRS